MKTITIDKDHLTKREAQTGEAGSEGLANQEVQLRVSCASNREFTYSLGQLVVPLGSGQQMQRVEQEELPGMKDRVVTEYGLGPNYPNPFNPSTVIRFSIAEKKFVTLKVYDVLGRQVAVLVEEQKQPGAYMVLFDASHLPSGVYFYNMVAGEYSSIKKMSLTK